MQHPIIPLHTITTQISPQNILRQARISLTLHSSNQGAHAELPRRDHHRGGNLTAKITTALCLLAMYPTTEVQERTQQGQFMFVDEGTLRTIINQEVSAALAEVKNRPRKMYTRKELCEVLHITLSTLDLMRKRGLVEAHKMGKRVLFDAEEVDKAISNGAIRKYKHLPKGVSI